MHTLTREEELALESNVMRVLATRPSDERTSAANKATLATPPQGGAEIMRPVKPMVATLSGHFKPTPATEKQKQDLIARRARASRDAYEARALSHNGSGPRMRRMRKHAVRVLARERGASNAGGVASMLTACLRRHINGASVCREDWE